MSRIKFAAVIALLVAAAWFTWHQQSQITRLTGELSTAKQALTSRIMAEDRKVVEAFELGRARQAQVLQKQKEAIDALEDQNRAATGALADARKRLRQQLAEPAGSPGGADVPSPGPQDCEALDAYRSRVLDAARSLVDGVLQVGADADEAARTFNTLILIDQSERAP